MMRASKLCSQLLGLVLVFPMGVNAEVLKVTIFINSFSDGLAVVNIQERHDSHDPEEYVNRKGAIDHNGQWVIKPNANIDFDNFSEGLAAAVSGNKWGYLDHSGQWAIDPQLESARNFSEGMASVKLNGKYGIIDLKGKWVFEPQFVDAGRFKDGLTLVKTSGAYGYMENDGKWAIMPQFSLNDAEDFSDGLARVKVNGKWGYMDHTGKLVIQPQFDGYLRPGPFSEGLASASITENGVTLKCGYIDHKGKWVFKPQFEEANNFSEGVASAELNGKNGYINHKGKWVIKPQYVYANDFSEGLAKVGIPEEVVNEHGGHDTHAAFIDHKGKVVISTERLRALVEPYISLLKFEL